MSVGGKKHVHVGELAPLFCLKRVVAYSNRNNVCFLPSNTDGAQLLKVVEQLQWHASVFSNRNMQIIYLMVGQKTIIFKTVNNFLGGYVLTRNTFHDVEEELVCLSKQMFQALKELNYQLKKYNNY